MFKNVITSLFGDTSSRFVKSAKPVVARVNALESTYQAMSDDVLADLTLKFRARLANGETLDDILPEAFAAVREAARRALGIRAFDVQLIGGLALHRGNISEMKTGEGKTLVATFAAYLNAIEGKGVHVVTVNDYLAKRDAAWMGKVYAKLGMTTSAIYHDLDATQRKQAYAADITFATNNELGFDYLRDNMALSPVQLVQRPLHYAVIDEVDSILIDEARTPLIISGPTEDKTELYLTVNAFAPSLSAETDYEIDEKQRVVHLTDAGNDKAEAFLKEKGLLPEDGNLYDVHNITLVHHVTQALRAHVLFNRDVEYIVKDGEVVLIDEFTGRMMPGRRLSEGLHQAIEAKEGLNIKAENQTMASITFQNLFRLYPKLAGMTGTAETEAEEFESIYNLQVISIPTNVAVSRVDEGDMIFRARSGKIKAIVADVADCHKRGQPVLVGTVSIERSEELARMLEEAKIPHKVLNARFHEQEAEIIAQAGRLGAVTIATNMAGRGTDIKLGGNIELLLQDAKDEKDAERIKAEHEAEHNAVMEAGGLRVIGTERHESRRIDNQLRGRSGRQGDVGSSVFYISLQDDLIKRFAPNMDGLMARLNMPDDEAIQHPWLSSSVATAQRKIESINFDVRKHVLKFDDVLNDQRKVIYDQRHGILTAESLEPTIESFREDVLAESFAAAFPPGSLPEQWQPALFADAMGRWFGVDAPLEQWLKQADVGADDILELAQKLVAKAWEQKQNELPAEVMANVQRMILLQTLDRLWRQHLQALDILRRGINMRAYAQKDPVNEFARESYMLFEDLLGQVKRETLGLLSRVRMVTDEAELPPPPKNLTVTHPDETGQPVTEAAPPQGEMADWKPEQFGVKTWDQLDPLDERIPRNAPCPCGSGKRFKACHGHLGKAIKPKGKKAA